MFYGTLILIFSTLIAFIIRVKSDKQSCVIKKIFPYFVLLIGGILATFTVMINR
jgi:hypothetical protein